MSEELVNGIVNRLAVLNTQPVIVIHPNGAKQHMDWIVGTTKYLSNMKKIIYDTTYLQPYNCNPKKIIDGCFAVDSHVVKIVEWCHIDDADHFIRILDTKVKEPKGTCFYLDGKLYMEDVPFIKADRIRNNLLTQRVDGTMWFDVLTVVDPVGNKTHFYPSKNVKLKHDLQVKNEAERKKRPEPTKKEFTGTQA